MRRRRWWRAGVPSLGARSAPIQDGGRTSLSAPDCRSCAPRRLFAVELCDRALPLFEGGLDPGERSRRALISLLAPNGCGYPRRAVRGAVIPEGIEARRSPGCQGPPNVTCVAAPI